MTKSPTLSPTAGEERAIVFSLLPACGEIAMILVTGDPGIQSGSAECSPPAHPFRTNRDGLLRANSEFFGFFYPLALPRVRNASGPNPR